MEKPKIRWVALICKCIFFAVCLVGGLCLYISGLEGTNRYVHTEGVELTARVVQVKESVDSEGDTHYDVFIEYTYNGQLCHQQHSEYKGASSAEVGDLTVIHVNPTDPMEIMEETKANSMYGCLIGCFLLMIAVSISGIRTRRDYCASFGIDRENIHQDLLRRVKNERGWLVCATGVATCILAILAGNRHWVLFATSVVTVLIGRIYLVAYLKRVRGIKEETYAIKKDRIVSKRIVEDSDGPDSYYLTCVDSEGNTYDVTASFKNYRLSNINDQIVAVWFDGFKRPYMNIHLHNQEIA